MLAKAELVAVLKDISASLTPGKDRDLAALADGYYGALNDCSMGELRAAATVIIREDSFFPRASRLRRLALEHRKSRPNLDRGPLTLTQQFDAWERDGMNGPCPVCGSVMEWPEGQRGGVVHDAETHRRQGIVFTYPSWAPPPPRAA